MTPDQIKLELPEIGTSHVNVGQLTEPGVHAINDDIAVRDLLNDGARRLDAFVCFGAYAHRHAAESHFCDREKR
jgi:hypothetical protein